jgi:hypothetical protein
MQSARTRSAPPPRAAVRENIRPSRLLPYLLLAGAGVTGLVFLVLMLFERHSVKRAAANIAEQEEPSRERIGSAPLPMLAVPEVPRLDWTTTTDAVLTSQGPDCLACAKRNGCLDPAQQGGSCDDVAGNAPGCGAGVTERDICYKTLADVFTSKCAETLQETPCLCGDTDVVQCLEGNVIPNGPILEDYACDLRTRDVTVIYRDFREPIYGIGRANSLIQCLGGYGCGCFGN